MFPLRKPVDLNCSCTGFSTDMLGGTGCSRYLRGKELRRRCVSLVFHFFKPYRLRRDPVSAVHVTCAFLTWWGKENCDKGVISSSNFHYIHLPHTWQSYRWGGRASGKASPKNTCTLFRQGSQIHLPPCDGEASAESLRFHDTARFFFLGRLGIISVDVNLHGGSHLGIRVVAAGLLAGSNSDWTMFKCFWTAEVPPAAWIARGCITPLLCVLLSFYEECSKHNVPAFSYSSQTSIFFHLCGTRSQG